MQEGSVYVIELDNGGNGNVFQGQASNTDLIPGKVITGTKSGAVSRIVNYYRGDELGGSAHDQIELILEEPVELAHDLSIPGFHVFPSDPRLLAITGDWHMDFPHDTLNIGRADPSAFTLAIKLPTSGGGMDWIDDQGTIKHLPYKEGELVMHSGLGLHRIAGIKKYVPDEYRITLQGHLIRRNNIMEMFW